MATSGSTSFKEKCDALIKLAYAEIGVYGKGRTLDAEDVMFARDKLNLMIGSWLASGIHLWCKTEAVLYLEQYQARYIINELSTSARTTLKTDEITTTLSQEFNITDTTINVESTANMAIGGNIGIVLNDLSTFWTTILTITSNTELTIASYPNVAISKYNTVYTFTNRIYKPMRILDARIVRGVDNGATSTKSEVIMNPSPYESYMHMANKSYNGVPNQYTFNPERDQGVLYTWPRPSDTNYRIEFTYERIIEDLDNATDDFDFPKEWQETIVEQLAVRLAPRYGKEEKVAKLTGPIAAELLNTLKMWDTEINSITFIPDMRED